MTLAMIPLITALAMVESDNGRTSANVLQITPVCVRDVNRICRAHGCDWSYKLADRENFDKSRAMAIIYLTYWGNRYAEATGKQPTAEVYARIWNGGPNGWKKPQTLRYWHKVESAYKKTRKAYMRKNRKEVSGGEAV